MNKTINISMPQLLLGEIRSLVQDGEFSSISDAIRYATRLAFKVKHSIPSVDMGPNSIQDANEAHSLYQQGELKQVSSVLEVL